MANHKSAAKRAKQNEKRRARNKSTSSAMNTYVKKFQAAVQDDSENTDDLLKQATSSIAKTAKKGVIHKNTGARKISRLTRQANDERIESLNEDSARARD